MASPTFRRLLWGLLIALALIAGYLQIFTLFMWYDDEGYVLISLNHFARVGDLYERVYSQYGPLFYLVFGGLARTANFAWTHDIGRFVTLGHWVGTAGVCGWICYQLTRSHLASAAAFAGTFAHLWQMSAEPMHPGGALALWAALGAAFSLKFLLSDRATHFAITVGLAAACCALVKINVGVFIAAAGGMWMLLNRSSRGKWSRAFDWLVVIVAAGGPAVLMLRSLGEPWAATYALVAGAAIGSVGACSLRVKRSDTTTSSALFAIGSAVTVVLVTTAAIWACGTSPHQLIQGSILGPLGHADVYHFPFNWRTGTTIGTILSIVACAFLLLRKNVTGWHHNLVGGFRVLLALTVILSSFSLPPRMLGFVMTTFGITLWWLIYSTDDSRPNISRGKAWIGMLAAWQFLHAYPVAGSQIGWSTFLWVPLAVAAIHESCLLWSNTRSIPALWRTKVIPWASGLAAGLIVIGQLHGGFVYFNLSAPLDLKGARHLRLSPSLGSSIRIMARNAQLANASLFSYPGAFSFNLWTGLSTPTNSNATHWFSLLDQPHQTEIEAELRTHHTPVIVQPGIIRTHLQEFIDPNSPLIQYLESDYESRAEVGLLALWRQKTDPRVLVNVAEHYTPLGKISPDSSAHIISVRLDIPAHEQIVAVEVGVFEPDGTVAPPTLFWHQGNTSIDAMPITATGVPLNGTTLQPITWPITQAGLHQFNFYPLEELPNLPLSLIWLRFRNSEGAVVTEARFANDP